MQVSDLLVSPVVEKGATSRRLYLPRGAWFDFWTEDRVDGSSDEGRPKGQAKGCKGAGVRGNGPKAGGANAGGAQHQGRKWNQDDKTECGNSEAKRQPETGNDTWFTQAREEERHVCLVDGLVD